MEIPVTLEPPPESTGLRPADRLPTVWHVGGEDVSMRIPLLLRLRALGFRVSAAGSEPPDRFAAHDIPYWRYPLERSLNPLADRKTLAALHKLFAERCPDVIHAFDTKPALLAPLAARRAQVPGCVRTITGMGYVFSSSSLLALGLRPVYRHYQRQASAATDVTVFQNQDDQQYFLDQQMVSPDRQTLVRGSGVDVAALEQQRPSEARQAELREQLGVTTRPVVTMIARLVRHKGVLEFIEAARRLRQQGLEADFLLAGPLEGEGRQAVARQQIDQAADVVRYLGVADDVPGLLSVSDLFVLPSYYREGVPRVLLEAGALGLPLVTTDMPGCKEVVQANQNGVLVPPRDATALAEAIGRLLDQRHDWPAMRLASRQHVLEHFDLSRVASACAAIYQRAFAHTGV